MNTDEIQTVLIGWPDDSGRHPRRLYKNASNMEVTLIINLGYNFENRK